MIQIFKSMGHSERYAPFLFWIKFIVTIYLFLLSQRVIAFLIIDEHQNLTLINYFQATFFGLSLDLSVLSYGVLLMTLFIYLSKWKNQKVSRFIQFGIALLSSMVILYALLVYIADHFILHYWGSHLNHQAFAYMNYPSQLVSSLPFFPTIFSLIVIVLLGIWIFNKVTTGIKSSDFGQLLDHHWIKNSIWVLIWFLMARGGLGKVPITITDSYKSKNENINLLSANALWNSFYYLMGNNTYPIITHFLNNEYFNDRLLKYYNSHDGPRNHVLNGSMSKPKNLVIIVMEGVSAQASIGCDGKLYNGTPLIDGWVNKHGIYAKNCYATSDRTDKGLASIFSGWPGQPWQGILHEPDKFPKLPHLMRKFKDRGYYTHFLYGGDMDFANIKAYMMGGGTDFLYDQNALNSKNTTNWGVNDADALDFLYHKLKQEKQPYLASALLLSSHEPYDIVQEKTKNEIEAYFKSVNYVDQSIDRFLKKCFKDKSFDDTWFLILSDHGKNLNTPETHFGQRQFFRIPFALVGKSIPKEFAWISDLCFSQADVYNSLLDLFFFETDPNSFYSRSIFRQNHPGNALFNMHEVAGMIIKEEMHWIGIREDQIKQLKPFNHWDSVILSLESKIIQDYFNLNQKK